jgi:prepilin-type processing-associated H-X9-DG protein
VYDQYNWNASYYDPSNRAAVGTPLQILQCPSAEPNRVVTTDEFPNGGQGACTDYAPISDVSSVLADQGLIDRAAHYQGALPGNQMVRIADIADGTASTIVIAEDAGRNQRWQVGRNVSGLSSTGGPWSSAFNRIVVYGSTRDGVTRPGSCPMNCTNSQEVYSFHTGGANVVFADGSVHFLQAGIDIRVLAALVTRAGGETVSASDY